MSLAAAAAAIDGLFLNSATDVADRRHLAKATGSRLPLSIPTCAESTLHSRLVLICGQDSRLALSPRSPLRRPMQPLGSSNVTRASQGIINQLFVCVSSCLCVCQVVCVCVKLFVCVCARACSMLYLSVVLLLFLWCVYVCGYFCDIQQGVFARGGGGGVYVGVGWVEEP